MGNGPFVTPGVDEDRLNELPLVAETLRPHGLLARFVQRRQEDGDEHRNDPDNHEQLDQREPAEARASAAPNVIRRSGHVTSRLAREEKWHREDTMRRLEPSMKIELSRPSAEPQECCCFDSIDLIGHR